MGGAGDAHDGTEKAIFFQQHNHRNLSQGLFDYLYRAVVAPTTIHVPLDVHVHQRLLTTTNNRLAGGGTDAGRGRRKTQMNDGGGDCRSIGPRGKRPDEQDRVCPEIALPLIV